MLGTYNQYSDMVHAYNDDSDEEENSSSSGNNNSNNNKDCYDVEKVPLE